MQVNQVEKGLLQIWNSEYDIQERRCDEVMGQNFLWTQLAFPTRSVLEVFKPKD